MFKLEFATDSAAFADDGNAPPDADAADLYARGMEIGRILRQVAERIEGGDADFGTFAVRDVNGNSVGTFSLD